MYKFLIAMFAGLFVLTACACIKQGEYATNDPSCDIFTGGRGDISEFEYDVSYYGEPPKYETEVNGTYTGKYFYDGFEGRKYVHGRGNILFEVNFDTKEVKGESSNGNISVTGEFDENGVLEGTFNANNDRLPPANYKGLIGTKLLSGTFNNRPSSYTGGFDGWRDQ